MQEFIIAAKVIIPLFFIIAFGYFLLRIHLVDEKFASMGNKLCFKVFLPVLLFYNIYTTDIRSLFDAKLILFAGCGIAAVFVLAWVFVYFFEKDNRKRGVMIQGMMRSNFVVLGMPVILNLFGENSGGLVGLLLAIVLPMYNILSVFALEYFAEKQKISEETETNKEHHLWKNILLQVITNPLILASFLAYLFVLCEIPVSEIVMQTITPLADVATGFSLLVLGASFQIKSIRQHWKQLFITVFTRLILVPGVMLSLAVWFGFRSIELATLTAVFASPAAVSSFSMAQIIGGDDDLAANIIVFTSFFSMFTLFLFIYIFESFHLL